MEKKKERLMDKNFSYKNPSISEALCEIHFNSNTFTETSLDELKEIFKPVYPDQSEKKIKQYQATISETGVLVSQLLSPKGESL